MTSIAQSLTVRKRDIQAGVFRCPTTGAIYQPRRIVQHDPQHVWAACALHDAEDRRPDDPHFDATMPQWHVHEIEDA